MNNNRDNATYYKGFLTIFKITLISLVISLTTILRYILFYIPNVELVTFILMISVLFFTLGISFSIINIFCVIQIILFGFADIAYFYIFNLYGIIIYLFKIFIFKWWLLFPILVFLFGLSFGLMYSAEMLLLFGWKYALAYWISGLVFDIVHAVGNCIFAIICYIPLMNLFKVMSQNKSFLFNKLFINLNLN